MASLPQERPNVAILNVDIKTWGSPVAKQYRISSIPYCYFFDPSGRSLGEGDRALEALLRVVK